MYSRIRFLVSVFAALLFVIGAAPELHAHARLLKSIPVDKGEISGSKLKIELWFNELLDEEFNSILVFRSSDLNSRTKTNLAKGKPILDKKDKTHLTIVVENLEPGEYIAEYRVLSRDGHSAPGRLRFTVTASQK